MPPRRSNLPTVPVEETEPAATAAPPREDDTLSVEDLNLPKSIVQRLAKGVLPPNTQIQKDALLAMSKGATVFVNYLTSAAAEEALRSGRKSVMPSDVFAAMRELEFEFMLPRLEAEVNKFTSIQADKRNTYRKKIREEKRAKNDPDGVSEITNGGTSFMSAGPAGLEDEEPRAKKARLDGEVGEGSDEEGVDETQDVEDEEVEDDEIVEDEAPEEGLTEDPLEEREEKEEEDEVADGDESD
ncbi:histone-fold-containing protein [Macroventuria anomochaeta]|uniref:Histone-fold-containing protein n=1 Tax=Macroventuria anomochaeta TaxID=301207 RepID=A0ACB6SE71_9PLEO|nr:histone-fold-containing protein [Macroventuria anomochaeta]KAF2631900.1 histone-fold-containing protein [Macroventuria anomochaeta]